MRTLHRTIFILLLFVASVAHAQTCPVIPKPVEYKQGAGYFYFKPTSYILVNDMESFLDAVTFRDMSIKFLNLPLKTVRDELYPSHYIEVAYDSTLMIPDGGYNISITEDKIIITGKNDGGVFYGLMSLLQMTETKFTNQFQVPCGNISDYPSFSYRGMHLDCVRHFFTVDDVKSYIDYMALYKMNTFHWHLTDDQGWRIEIKKYPKLTEIGAYRSGSMVGHYRDHKFDTVPYGGFYTQAEIKEIVRYAERRHVTIIPEIEMPGHCRAALAAYPELGCIKDTTFTVGQEWGVYPEAFCPKPETFQFLYDVLDEVMALFPSSYIHIGGDEVEKEQWKHCDFCQQLILDKKLLNETGLQDYFTKTIETYIISKGRNIIGWDEILNNNLDEGSVVMSWRGDKGGIEAAKLNHGVIMTPNSHCYFDYYQGDPTQEPLAIGGYVPLDKVYQFQPVPSSLTPEEATYILGAQGNLWTEYVNDFNQVEYMIIPRMLALSEVLWTNAGDRDYQDFMRRLKIQFELLDKVECNYSKSAFSITPELSPAPNNEGVLVTLHAWDNATGFGYQIERHDVPGAIFDGVYQNEIYNGPFVVTDQLDLEVPETPNYRGAKLDLYFNKATGKSIKLGIDPAPQYSANGGFTLVDGVNGVTFPGWSSKQWLGFSGTNMVCTVDLGKVDTIESVGIGFLIDKGSWIYPAQAFSVEVSMDGKRFKNVGTQKVNPMYDTQTSGSYKFNSTPARYVRITAINHGTIEEGNPGAGKKAWLFVDEVYID